MGVVEMLVCSAFALPLRCVRAPCSSLGYACLPCFSLVFGLSLLPPRRTIIQRLESFADITTRQPLPRRDWETKAIKESLQASLHLQGVKHFDGALIHQQPSVRIARHALSRVLDKYESSLPCNQSILTLSAMTLTSISPSLACLVSGPS